MLDILLIIPGKKRITAGGWHAFNAVCCHHRGHKPDKRQRAGIIFGEDSKWAYSCFNCGFKCGAEHGKQFSSNTRLLLEWCGVDKTDINRLNFENYSIRGNSLDLLKDNKPIVVNFDKKNLPEGSVQLDPLNPEHQIHIDYLNNRGLSTTSYTYYITPNSTRERDKNRIIIPYYYHGEIVGYTSRFYDNRAPKYVSEQQRGYVFNVDKQRHGANSCILVEGQFDAISIDGCAYLGATISDTQIRLLSKLNREIIVVPDRDKTGMKVCDRALELGYKVSIPEWSSDIKDVNDAVKKYGKLPTLLSILESASSSKITVEMKRKKFK